MTTEELQPIKPRSVDECLKIIKESGYSSLTDEEIENVIEWRATQKTLQSQALAGIALQNAAIEQMRIDAQQTAENLKKSFETACNTAIKFKVIDDVTA